MNTVGKAMYARVSACASGAGAPAVLKALMSMMQKILGGGLLGQLFGAGGGGCSTPNRSPGFGSKPCCGCRGGGRKHRPGRPTVKEFLGVDLRTQPPARPKPKIESGSPTGLTPSATPKTGVGAELMGRAKEIGNQINSSGGYRFDGHNDCYGFVRRVLDPVLQANGRAKLPVNDGPNSGAWGRIDDWDKLKPGTALSTHQGHMWGDQWHGGIYAGKIEGKHYIYDSSSSQGGVKMRELPPGLFNYYHTPSAEIL